MKIAYLSPAMPALSETFVYEELLAVERRGIAVVPVSVRKPFEKVAAQQALASRVVHLYGGFAPWVALKGLLRLTTFGKRTFVALGQLLSDIGQVGLLHVAAWKLVYQFLAATKLAKILLDQHCTHLHVHFAHTPTQIAMYASAMSGVPFTIMAHANDIFEAGLLLKTKAQRASRMLTISEFNVRHLVGLGIPSDRLAVVRCGVSFGKPSGLHATPVDVASDTPFKIGSLGRLVEKKGFDVLLHSVAELHQAGRRIELHIAGDGPLGLELKALSASLGIADHVHFVGSLNHDAVATWMGEMDAFVLACKADANGDMDGIPVVLMEAMSQGIPVVSTQLSGIPELVQHLRTGLLAQPNDSTTLVEQITFLMSSSEMRLELATAAQVHVTHEFGQSENIDRLLTHFH